MANKCINMKHVKETGKAPYKKQEGKTYGYQYGTQENGTD
jgi:hypothetical protein